MTPAASTMMIAVRRGAEPRLVRGGLGGDVDQLEVGERVAVGQLDVAHALVVAGEHRTRLGLDDGRVDIVARERADRVARSPARHDDDLRAPAVALEALEPRVDEAVGRLEHRSHRAVEVGGVGVRVGLALRPGSPAPGDHRRDYKGRTFRAGCAVDAASSRTFTTMIEALTDTLEVRLLHPEAVPPARSRSGDAGYDLCATERV